MKEYQYISILKVFLLYIIALLPTWILLFKKNTYTDKKTFLKKNSILIFIEIIIFSIIYIFPKEIVTFFTLKSNIQNYMMYSLKILFISSSTTVLHYTVPIFLSLQQKKIEIWLFFSKLAYIPIILIFNFLFNTKGALFAIPLCDILYNLFLFFQYKKYSIKI